MAAKFLLAAATVTGANTATRITQGETTPTLRVVANFCIIQALSSNSASVFIGDSTVSSSATTGIELTPGSSVRLPPIPAPNGINMADLYFASTSASAVVSTFFIEG